MDSIIKIKKIWKKVRNKQAIEEEWKNKIYN